MRGTKAEAVAIVTADAQGLSVGKVIVPVATSEQARAIRNCLHDMAQVSVYECYREFDVFNKPVWMHCKD